MKNSVLVLPSEFSSYNFNELSPRIQSSCSCPRRAETKDPDRAAEHYLLRQFVIRAEASNQAEKSIHRGFRLEKSFNIKAPPPTPIVNYNYQPATAEHVLGFLRVTAFGCTQSRFTFSVYRNPSKQSASTTTKLLNNTLPHRWIGRTGPRDNALHSWPPRSPDLTPCDFFLWGYVKEKVFVPPLTHDIEELKNRITVAIRSVNADTLCK
ncbi:hypothetical protein J6590_091835, partial [Homalodisca vitripennis]